MFDFRMKILDVIQENEQIVAPFLSGKAMRTHAFLGSCQHIPQPVFSRRGENALFPCILSQVYAKSYPPQPTRPPTFAEQLPFFELYRIDCSFFAPRTFDKYNFPVVWEYDWHIEIENELTEFAMTLRGLLDFTCNRRLGIFFADGPDLKRLTDEFLPSWDHFATKYPYASELGLQVIFFPTSYSTWNAYADLASSFVWDPASRTFRPS